jgi:hypothetical protein
MTFEEKNVLNINNGILALFHFYNGIEANPINFKEDLECIFSLYKNDYRYRNDENKYFLIEVSERMLDFEYLINKDKVWRLEGTDDEPEGMQEFVKVYCDAYNASLEVHWYFEELYPNEFIGYDEIPIPIMSIDYNLQQKDPEKQKPEQETPKTFDELFYNTDLVKPCIDILKELDPPLIDTDCNYIGKLKGVFCVWIDEMQRQGIVKHYSDRKIFASLIPQKIKRFSIDESMFGKYHIKAENLYRTDIKTRVSNIKLSQNSQ